MIWYPCSEFHNCTATIHQLPPQMQPLSLSHIADLNLITPKSTVVSQPPPNLNLYFMTTITLNRFVFHDHLSLSLSPLLCFWWLSSLFTFPFFFFFLKKINVTFFILFFGFLLFWGWNVKIFVYIILYICLRADKIWKSR